MGSKKSKGVKAQVVEFTEEVEADTVTFDVWFYRKVKEGLAKDYQKAEIQVHLTECGLSNNESETKYNEAFKSF